jgi:hypothetical protein
VPFALLFDQDVHARMELGTLFRLIEQKTRIAARFTSFTVGGKPLLALNPLLACADAGIREVQR